MLQTGGTEVAGLVADPPLPLSTLRGHKCSVREAPTSFHKPHRLEMGRNEESLFSRNYASAQGP